MLRYGVLLAVGVWAGVVFAACGDSGSGTLCEPGTEVFCKCRGGFDGTKTCLEDGNSFGACLTPDGECPEIGSTTSTEDPKLCDEGEEKECECADGMSMGTQTCADDGESFGPCMLNGSECAMAGTKNIYEPCSSGSECLTGTCEGFCTKPCGNFMECTDNSTYFGDCVNFGGGVQVCAQYCLSQGHCNAAAPDGYGYAADVQCGATPALDDPSFVFAACGRWSGGPQGFPYGTPCDEAAGTVTLGGQPYMAECDLGLPATQNTCLFGECSESCFEDVDCPNMDCDNFLCCTSNPSCN